MVDSVSRAETVQRIVRWELTFEPTHREVKTSNALHVLAVVYALQFARVVY